MSERLIVDVVRSFNESSPLKIERATWRDWQLHLSGVRWSFNSLSPWRLVDDARMIVGSDDESAKHYVGLLVGESVISARIQTESLPLDPVLLLSNGWKLELFSVCALEPWVIHLPNNIFVASPTDPEV